jgi:hypothetical protein
LREFVIYWPVANSDAEVVHAIPLVAMREAAARDSDSLDGLPDEVPAGRWIVGLACATASPLGLPRNRPLANFSAEQVSRQHFFSEPLQNAS